MSSDNGDSLFSNCPRVRWPNVRLLDIHCYHRYGSAEYVELIQNAVQGIVEERSVSKIGHSLCQFEICLQTRRFCR